MGKIGILRCNLWVVGSHHPWKLFMLVYFPPKGRVTTISDHGTVLEWVSENSRTKMGQLLLGFPFKQPQNGCRRKSNTMMARQPDRNHVIRSSGKNGVFPGCPPQANGDYSDVVTCSYVAFDLFRKPCSGEYPFDVHLQKPASYLDKKTACLFSIVPLSLCFLFDTKS